MIFINVTSFKYFFFVSIFRWGAGSKSLTINQVFSILQTKRDTGDWKEAFKHLPIRKLKKIPSNSEITELYSDKLYVVSSN